MEAETNFSGHVSINDDSPRMSTCTEVTGLSEAVDIQAERSCHDAACINTTVDGREREGAVRIERLSRTAHDGCEHDHCPEGQAVACQCGATDACVNHDHHQGGSEHCSQDRSPPPGEVADDCTQLQPSSTTNLVVCDPPAQCADVTVCSSDMALQTTNVGQFSLHVAVSFNIIHP